MQCKFRFFIPGCLSETKPTFFTGFTLTGPEQPLATFAINYKHLSNGGQITLHNCVTLIL